MNVEFAEAGEEVAELSEATSSKSKLKLISSVLGLVLLVDRLALLTSQQFDVTNILKVT